MKESQNQTAKKTWKKTVFVILLMCLWVVSSVIAVQLVVGNLMIWILGRENFVQPIWTAIYSAVVYVLAGLLIIFVPPKLKLKLAARRGHKKPTGDKHSVAVEWRKLRSRLGLSGLVTWTDVGLAPIGFVVSLILAAGLVALFSLFPWFDAEQAQDVGFSVYMSGGDRIIAFVTLVVVAPIAEEIIFRGWLYDGVRRKLADRLPKKVGVALSILIVSVIFGLIHFQWNVGVNVFALSVVLCGLREITGTIYAGVLVHMIKNGIAFYLLYVLGLGG